MNPHKWRKQWFRSSNSTSRGVSLIELLIVLSILALLLVLWYVLSQTQLSRSRDAQRKADLDRISIAFEDYFNDTNCYPDPDILLECGSTAFQPYLDRIPCDPISGEPYVYVPLEENQCKGYRVYAALEDKNDPIINQLGCAQPNGCGVGSLYNYGISAGVPVVIEGYPIANTPIPSPTTNPGGTTVPNPSIEPSPPIIYVFACDAAGTCNQYEENHPYLINCPVTFEQSNCNNACGDVVNRCAG